MAEQTKINKPEQKKSCSKGVQHCTVFLYCHAQKISENFMDKRFDDFVFLFFQSLHCNMGRVVGEGEGGVSKRGSSNMLQGAALEFFQGEFP